MAWTTVVCTGVGAVGIMGAKARDDGGSKTFFQTPPEPSAPAEGAQRQADRTLTISRRRPNLGSPDRMARGRVLAPSAVASAEPLRPPTRFTDRTLRPGDAVMTTRGWRVFAGATTFPYRETDFTTVDKAYGLSRQARAILMSMTDRPPI